MASLLPLLTGCFRFAPLTDPAPPIQASEVTFDEGLVLRERLSESLGFEQAGWSEGIARISGTLYLSLEVLTRGARGVRLVCLDFETGAPSVTGVIQPVQEGPSTPHFVFLGTQPPTLASIGKESQAAPATDMIPIVQLSEAWTYARVRAAGRFVAFDDFYFIAPPHMEGLTISLARFDGQGFRVLERNDYNIPIVPFEIAADGEYAAVVIRGGRGLQVLRHDPNSGESTMALDDVSVRSFVVSVRGPEFLCAWSRGPSHSDLAVCDGRVTKVFQLGKQICRIACLRLEHGAVAVVSCHPDDSTSEHAERAVFVESPEGEWSMGPWVPQKCVDLRPVEIARKPWMLRLDGETLQVFDLAK